MMRTYFPPELGPESIVTAFGVVNADGLPSEGLDDSSLSQLETMVEAGLLSATGEPPVIKAKKSRGVTLGSVGADSPFRHEAKRTPKPTLITEHEIPRPPKPLGKE
jgi:hypothetical protein